MNVRIVTTGAVIAALSAAGAAATQETQALRLQSGFMPDPQAITVPAGGAMSASDLVRSTRGVGGARMGDAGDGHCRGRVSQAPTVRLEYASFGRLPLIITNRAEFDTTLAVLAPDGTWYCDDDSGRGVQAELAISDPGPGTYAVWLGAFIRSRDGADAAVRVSVR